MQSSTPRRLPPEDRRSALVDAAVRVLQHRVMADLSFEAVADEAGVSKTLPYRYFDSPAEIAVALFDRVVGMTDQATDYVLGSDLDFDEKVRATLNLWCDAIESGGHLVQRVLEAKAVAALQPLIAQRDLHAVEVWSQALAREFSLDATDAEFLAVFLTAAATSSLSHWSDHNLDRKDVIERFVQAARAAAQAFSRR